MTVPSPPCPLEQVGAQAGGREAALWIAAKRLNQLPPASSSGSGPCTCTCLGLSVHLFESGLITAQYEPVNALPDNREGR